MNHPRMYLGRIVSCPTNVCDSGRIAVIGCETKETAPRQVASTMGEYVFRCVEIGLDGNQTGLSFAVGSDELMAWQEEFPCK